MLSILIKINERTVTMRYRRKMSQNTPELKLQKLSRLEEGINLCNDLFIGTQILDTNKYLPKFTGEGDASYKRRIRSTLFNNLYSPIISGLVGVVTQKQPKFDDRVVNIDSFSKSNVDGLGTNFFSFIKEVLTQSMVQGCSFVAINNVGGKIRLKLYEYIDLYNYMIDDENNIVQWTFRESLDTPDGRFGTKKVFRYVVYKRRGGEVWVSEGTSGAPKKTQEWSNDIDTPTIVRLKVGYEKSINEIYPRLYDIARMNQTLLEYETNLANVLNVVGNPIPVFYNEDGALPEENEKINVGLKDAPVFKNKQKEGLEYVEIEGKSVEALEKKITKVIEDIDKLSFSLLTRKQAKTVIEAVDAQTKSQGFIVDVAYRLENSFNLIYDYIIQLTDSDIPLYSKGGGENIIFNKDYENIVFSIDQLEIFSNMVSAGQISLETFWKKLANWTLLPHDFDIEKERKNIINDRDIIGINIEESNIKDKEEDPE